MATNRRYTVSRARRLTVALTVLAAATFAAPPPAYAAGVVSGPTRLELLPFATWGLPAAADPSGDLVGVEGNAGGCSLRAVRWSGGDASVLDTPAGFWSRAFALNAAGTAVGFVSSHLPDDNDCVTPVPQAMSWTAAGVAVPLAPDYPGTTVASAINDAGDIVGYAVPAGNDRADAVAVKFVDGQVLPLATDDPLPMDGNRALGRSGRFRPGPNLTNDATGNLAFGSAVTADGAPQPYVAALGDGAMLPTGASRRLSGASAQTIESSADGSVVVGSEFSTGTLWRRIFRSGHPGYKPYDLRLPVNSEYVMPVGISPDGTLAVALGDMSGWGYVFDLASKQPVPVTGATITGITDAGLLFGYDSGQRPAVWHYTP
jgi:hypothetical protein